MSSNYERINELIEDVVTCRQLVPKSVEAMDELSKKYYQQWKSKIDKIGIDKKFNDKDIQLSDRLKANTNANEVTSIEEMKQEMITTLKVLEIMLENKRSSIGKIINKT